MINWISTVMGNTIVMSYLFIQNVRRLIDER